MARTYQSQRKRFRTESMTLTVRTYTAPAERSKVLAQFAKTTVAGLIAKKEASPLYTRFVDGVAGAAEETVQAEGSILYRFAYLGEVVTFALAFLKARSPYGGTSKPQGGHYRDSFMVSVNGRPIRAESFDPAKLTDVTDIFIYNRQPYGRKVDVQLIGKKPINFDTKPFLFDDCVAALKPRFGNLINVSRIYTVHFADRWVTKVGRLVEYPALEITLR